MNSFPFKRREKNSPLDLLLSRVALFPSPSDSGVSQGSGVGRQDGGVGLIVGRYNERRTCLYRVRVLLQPFHPAAPLYPRVVASGGLANCTEWLRDFEKGPVQHRAMSLGGHD